MSGVPAQCYSVVEIKKFLLQTKHARNVQIDDYFPDVEQFLSKTRLFLAEGRFTEREGFRLRKYVTKLNTVLGNSDTDSQR